MFVCLFFPGAGKMNYKVHRIIKDPPDIKTYYKTSKIKRVVPAHKQANGREESGKLDPYEGRFNLGKQQHPFNK